MGRQAGAPACPACTVAGVDVARGGEDKTVVAIRLGPVLAELRRSSKEDTMQTTGRVKGHLDTDPDSDRDGRRDRHRRRGAGPAARDGLPRRAVQRQRPGRRTPM